MQIHTPSAFGLGVLAGLEDSGHYGNPYDDYLEKYEHKNWVKGYEMGEKIKALLPVEPE